MCKKALVIPGPFVPYNDTITLLSYNRLKSFDLQYDVLALENKKDKALENELKNDKDFSKFNIKYLFNYDDVICLNSPYKLPLAMINMIRYVKKVNKIAKKNKYDYVFTFSLPGITHFCGNAVKKSNPKIKWIASFSDPIKNSPYKKDPFLKYKNIIYRIMFHVGLFVYMNNSYEKVALKNADKVIFICEEHMNFTINQYPNLKGLRSKCDTQGFTFIKNWKVFQSILSNTNNIDYDKKPLTAVHMGRIYGLRKIDTFLEAINDIKKLDNSLSKKIVFHQYSEMPERDIKYIKNNNLVDVFIYHDEVDYQNSIEILKNADVLLLFDTILPDEMIQPYLPSKIIEYLLLQKEILAVCGSNSPTYRILKNYGYDKLGYKKEDIINNINKVIEFRKTYNINVDELDCNNTKKYYLS